MFLKKFLYLEISADFFLFAEISSEKMNLKGERVLEVAISGDGELLVIKFDQKPYLRVVKCKDPHTLHCELPDGGPDLSFFFADQTSYDLVVETPSSAIIVNAKSGKLVRKLGRKTSIDFVMSSSIGGRYLAVCTFDDGGLYCWDLKLGDLSRVPLPENKEALIDSACVSPNGTHVAVCYQDTPPMIVSVITGKVILKLDVPWATGVEYSLDGKLLVTLGEEVAVWETDTGKLRFKDKLSVPAEAVFTPENDLVVALSGVGAFLVGADKLLKSEDRIALSPGGKFVVFYNHHNIEVTQFNV